VVWVADRLTKIWAVRFLDESRSVEIASPWLAFTLHRNAGAAFGLGSHAPRALALFAAVLTLVLAVWWMRIVMEKNRAAESLALALILGGSAGNLLDRFREGAVIDFIDLKVWPIFNVADSAITAGFVLWVLCMLLRRKNDGEGRAGL
jgi:signal peptidase II